MVSCRREDGEGRIRQLPKPDQYGNYWFGRRTLSGKEPADPAIFASKRLDKVGSLVETGMFFIFLGSDRGFLFVGEELKMFRSPQEALARLNKLVG